MNSINKHYVITCGQEGKMFILNGERLESMTLQEYNERNETTYSSWYDVDDDYIFSSEEIIEMFGEEDVKFV